MAEATAADTQGETTMVEGIKAFFSMVVQLAWIVLLGYTILHLTDMALKMQNSRQGFEQKCMEQFNRTCSTNPASATSKIASTEDVRALAAYKTLASIRLNASTAGKKELQQDLGAAVKIYIARGILPRSAASLPEDLVRMNDKTVAAIFAQTQPATATSPEQKSK